MKAALAVSIDTGGHRARVLASRDDLVTQHLGLVEGIARKVASALPPCFELDDLIATGHLALLHAATRYRPQAHNGTPFSAYARKAVHGAIVESVRRKRYTEATRPGLEILQPKTTRPREGLLHDRDIPEMARLATPAVAEDALDAMRMARRLAEAVASLPAAQQRVLRIYYDADEPTLQEVARRLAFSKSRTRELHAAAIDELRHCFKRAA
jgi:RNA polymerase sigma factor (sigma-70 family)